MSSSRPTQQVAAKRAEAIVPESVSYAQMRDACVFEGYKGFMNTFSKKSGQYFSNFIYNALLALKEELPTDHSYKEEIKKLLNRLSLYSVVVPPERKLLVADVLTTLPAEYETHLPPAPKPEALHSDALLGRDAAGSNIGVIAFDLETTGKSPSADRIVEIAAHDVFGSSSEHATFSTLVCPGTKRMNEKASAVSGITDSMLHEPNVPTFPRAFHWFEQWVEQRKQTLNAHEVVLISHNGKTFDCKFLQQELARIHPEHELQLAVPSNWYFADSLIVAKDSHPSARSRKLVCSIHAMHH